MSTSYVNAAGLRLRVARTGRGTPAAADHRASAPTSTCGRRSTGSSRDRELIAFDAPGVGLSQRPRLPLRMHQLARIVRELMDALALERADVLGYSFGGALAQELARRAPGSGPAARAVRDRARPGRGPSPADGGAHAGDARALLPPAAARAQRPAYRGRAAPRATRPCSPSMPARAWRGRRTCSATPTSCTRRRAGRACRGCTACTQPTLDRGGRRRIQACRCCNARMLAARLPDARLHVIKGGGHLFLLDEPQSAVGRILGFLDERM